MAEGSGSPGPHMAGSASGRVRPVEGQPRVTVRIGVRGSIRVLIALAVGLSFALRSLLSFAGPNLWNASSLLDYVAVVSWKIGRAHV